MQSNTTNKLFYFLLILVEAKTPYPTLPAINPVVHAA